jgi:hypothetical protein
VGIPIRGLNITFTPSIQPARVVNKTSTPPVSIIINNFTATTNDDGVLCGPDGMPGVPLISSTDIDLNPHDWTWDVSVEGSRYERESYSFSMGINEVVDLSTVVRVPADIGVDTAAWTQAVADTLALKNAAELSATKADTARAAAVVAKDAAAASAASVNRGGANGVAPLDAGMLLPEANVPTRLATTQLTATIAAAVAPKAPSASPAFTGTPTGITKAHVGLANVDNTSDALKPVSTAQAAAIASKIASGSGVPLGVVTANVGSIYTDTAATLGARVWYKASGAGNTGWVVLNGDTGWRALYTWNSSGAKLGTPIVGIEPTTGVAGGIYIRRISRYLRVQIIGATFNASATIPPTAGMAAEESQSIPVLLSGAWAVANVGTHGVTLGAAGSVASDNPRVFINVTPGEAWPTSLPGTAA